MKYFFTFLLITSGLFSFAQEEKKEELVVHKIKGKEYYIHVVDTGNTLFAISRKYAIPREEIKKANPSLTDILTLGDRLLIPLDKIKRKDLDEAPDIDGNFLIHEVQKKNTLYSLAKEYNVEINDIILQNPEVENGLKKGMKIKIPVAKIKSDAANTEYVVPAAASPYITHTVLPKETLYSLSKLYMVTIDSLKQVNNGLVGGLREGELINIPILKSYEKETEIKPVDFDSTAVREYYEVALLLPFYLERMKENNEAIEKASNNRIAEKLAKKLHNDAKYAIEFYQGFKIAADSLTQRGLNIKLTVFDTSNDSLTVSNLLEEGKLDEADLIVGPLYLDNFMMVADFAKRSKKNIVSPVKLSNKILLGNSYVSKVATSSPIQSKFLGKFMYDSLRFKNTIMVYPNQFNEIRRAEYIKKEFNKAAQNTEDTNRIVPFKEVFWDEKSTWGLSSKFSDTDTNIIVVPSKDQAFVTRLLTFLYGQNDYQFIVYGMDEWKKFDNIEVAYLQDLNVHLITSEFVSNEDWTVEAFKQKFVTQYTLLPEKYSYLGYDVGIYYLSLLKEHGLNFEHAFPTFKKTLLGRKFDFQKTGIESGYENHSIYIVRYQNFQKKKVH